MSKHKPWNIEIYRGFDSDFTEDQLLVNRPIREFLDSEDKFFLVGAKGLGKTLFLRYKSFLYHNKYGSLPQYTPSQSEMTDNLRIHTNTFSKEDLLRFRDGSLWCTIWEISLWIILFQRIKSPIPPRLEKLIFSSNDLSSILGHLLNNRNQIDQFKAFISEFQNQRSKIQNAVVLFIDDVDQALHHLLKTPHYTDSFFGDEQSPSVEVWVNAQAGLMDAVYNLNRQNAHIKIYATIRKEAFEAFEGQMKINYQHFVSTLDYTKGEIKEIFEKNIQLIKSADLTDRFAQTPTARFLGFDEFPHRFAESPDGTRRIEKVFDFIYRHTYGRPREIVFMGARLGYLTVTPEYKEATDEERHEQVRAIVNQVSNELFQQYTQEVVPYWDEARLLHFVASVRSNVIVKEDFRLFDQDMLSQYHNLGLIGHVKLVNHKGGLQQFFKPPATYNYRRLGSLPITEYLLIHSTMDKLLLDQHTYGGFHNPYNIIGNGYDFYPRVDNPIFDNEYYIPKDVLGNRFRSASESSGHIFPLENIYRNFFAFDKADAMSRYERFQSQMKIAEQALGLLGRVCYSHRLEKEYKTGLYATKKTENNVALSHLHISRTYNSAIPNDHSDQALDCFLDKIFGRYITLCCYLVLDLRLEWIHNLLTRGKFEFSHKGQKKDTAMAYLSRSFFIRDLKIDEPRDPGNHHHRQLKQRIFSYLSPWEQNALRNFIRNASDEVKYLAWIEDPAHKAWLRDHVLNRIWKPD